MRFFPTRQGLIEQLWGGLLVAAVIAIGGAAWSQRQAIWMAVPAALYLVGFVLLACTLGLGAIRLLEVAGSRRRKGDPTSGPVARAPIVEPPQEAPKNDPAAAAGLERLREIYTTTRKATIFASEWFRTDLNGAGFNSQDASHRAIAKLLGNHLMPQVQGSNVELTYRVGYEGPVSPEILTGAIHSYQRVLETYAELLDWIIEAGTIYFGRDQLLSLSRYRELWDRHQNCIRDLRLVEGRTDIGPVAKRAGELEKALPPPIRASEQQR